MDCYKDKDEIKYYGAEDRANVSANGDFSQGMAKKRINGSDYDKNYKPGQLIE